MRRISISLVNNGYDVTLVGFNKKHSKNLEILPYKQIRLHLLFNSGKLFFIEYNVRIFFWMLFKKFDFYCGIDLDTLLPVFLNAKLKNKPCIYDAHEYYTQLPEIICRPIIRRIWLKMEQFLLPKIKYNYTVCQSIANALSSAYGQHFEVIRNVPLLENDAIDYEIKHYIIYQGALNEGRGIEQLLEAMQYINTTLYIAGEGDLSSKLRSLHQHLAYKDKIHFLGNKTPLELKLITQKAILGINLIENKGLSYFYSLSNKFFDYIHAGIPQVTMKFPEYEQLNNQYEIALLIDNLEPKKIANAINQLLNDNMLTHKLHQNCLKAKAELNWQIEEKTLIEFYKYVH